MLVHLPKRAIGKTTPQVFCSVEGNCILQPPTSAPSPHHAVKPTASGVPSQTKSDALARFRLFRPIQAPSAPAVSETKACSSEVVMDARCAVLLQHLLRSRVASLAENQESAWPVGRRTEYRWLLAPAPAPNLRRLAQST
jgi:hypothetical protein